jgi:septum site-determining protein MinC
LSSLTCQRQSLTFRARSYTAFVFTLQPPIEDWLADLDAMIERSKGFFSGQPIALDLSAATLSPVEIAELVNELEVRSIRLLGIEGINPAAAHPRLPPILRGGRGQEIELPTPVAASAPVSAASAPVAAAAPKKQEVASLMIDSPVRSGQSVVNIDGDITVLGSVGSGAELIAGGSIHIYGTLRGLAMAGAGGNLRARIFCHRFEGELLAIGSHYKTADEIESNLRRGPTQAWLDGDTLKISAMN